MTNLKFVMSKIQYLNAVSTFQPLGMSRNLNTGLELGASRVVVDLLDLDGSLGQDQQ